MYITTEAFDDDSDRLSVTPQTPPREDQRAILNSSPSPREGYIKKLNKQLRLLKQQVKELNGMLKLDYEDNENDCKICYARPIDTVFLECAHRMMCSRCAKNQSI